LVHLRDIHRWSNINHLETRLRDIQAVLETILNNHLLSAPEYTAILRTRLDAPLQGLEANAIRLASLKELLDENWLGEGIIDACMALYSDELNNTIPNLIRIFDCNFYVQLTIAFCACHACSMLMQLREELLANLPFLVAFVVNKNGNHWAPAITSLLIWTIFQGDLYGYPNKPNLFAIVQWWLREVVLEDSEWRNWDLAVPRQDSDSGSCRLAAVSEIAQFARIQEDVFIGASRPIRSRLWTNETSLDVRFEWIQLILHRHLFITELQSVSINQASLAGTTNTVHLVST
jgi:hypothetical protein